MKREPFPLQWPDSFKRTARAKRERSKFGFKSSGQVSFSHALMELRAELDRLGARNVTITTDLPVRNDGLPYASGRADDTGVAVWFVLKDQERVFCCDRWLSHAENMIAIARSIEAMRGLGRWGMADVVEKAMGGFAALPAAGETTVNEPPPKAVVTRTWQELFQVVALVDVVPARDLLAIVKARHRDLIKQHHPDLGGDAEVAIEMNAALAAAEKELAP